VFDAAMAAFRKASQLDDNPLILAWLGYSYAISGRRREARQILAELKKLSKRRHVDSFCVAIIHTALGEKEPAFAWLEKAYEERSWWLVALKLDPSFDRLRSDPWLAALLEKIGLEG